MARFATLSGNIVTNIIECDGAFAASVGAVACPDGDIGDLHLGGGSFTAPPAPAPKVPRSVTMRQARLTLHGAGMLAGVEAAINALPEPQKSAARIEWEYSGEVQRHNGFVAALGPALGLTSAQLDGLFIAAAAL